MQREPGALRDRARSRAAALRRDGRVRERCPYRGRAWRRRRSALVLVIERERPGRRAPPSTCRWTCLSASRRRCIATCSASRALDASSTLDRRRSKTRAFDVLRHPTVASKRFLITIGDRTVGGLSTATRWSGPWQVPVADCAVTLADYAGFQRRGDVHGRAHAAGRRSNAPAASGRMAVGEAITNLLAAPIELGHARSSAATGWRRAATIAAPGDDAALYDTVTRRRHGAVPGARASARPGRQGQPVDANSAGRARTVAQNQVTAPVSLDSSGGAFFCHAWTDCPCAASTPCSSSRRRHDPCCWSTSARGGCARPASTLGPRCSGQFGDARCLDLRRSGAAERAGRRC